MDPKCQVDLINPLTRRLHGKVRSAMVGTFFGNILGYVSYTGEVLAFIFRRTVLGTS